MAKIIYKEGFKDQNKLKCIEGIEIELFNKQKVLIYPKYSEERMLESIYIPDCDIEADTEINALKRRNNNVATSNFYHFNSPATKFVRQFRSVIFDKFNLPTLLAAMEIQDQKKDIDRLAETIEGADLLRDFTSFVWSCSRYDEDNGWIANGYNGLSSYSRLYHSLLAVPTILY